VLLGWTSDEHVSACLGDRHTFGFAIPAEVHLTKSEIHITHVKPLVFGFALERSASQRSLWVLDDMSGKIDTVYCVLVVATAVLVGIVKCTRCGSSKPS
jgi:hypothetical protein